MNYKSYQHIEKLGSTEVDGILNGICYLTYKIDGTNACIWLKDDNTLGFGSRKRELSDTKDGDNQGLVHMYLNDSYFHTVLYNELLSLLKKHPNWILYGEWLVPVNLKTYKSDAWKNLYIFDIYDADKDKYINYDFYSKLFDDQYPDIKYIPLLAKLENPTEDDIKALLIKTGDYLVTQGLGEGIVIKNYDYLNKYGRRTWAKILTEDFLEKRKGIKIAKKIATEAGAAVEYEIIKLLTVNHIEKEKAKLLENHRETDWNVKYLPELLNRVFTEFFRDNWEIILKKFHNPTINFKELKKASDKVVKDWLGIK